VVDAIGTTVLRFEGADVLVALRTRRVVEFKRPRLDARIRFGARDLQNRQCRLYCGERRAANGLSFTRHVKFSIRR